MAFRKLLIFILSLSAIQSTKVAALTTKEFFAICEFELSQCSQHPLLQAYIGGALDLLATLGEQTQYLDSPYCSDPREIFDIPGIIRFMHQHREAFSDSNAMLPVVRYFEEKGGC